MLLSTGKLFGGSLAVPIVYGTLNPADKYPLINLSNGNLTANKVLDSTWCHVRSTTFHSSGKFYYEWTAVEFSGSFIAGGFSNSSASLSSYAGSDANGISLVTNGQVFKSGGGANTLAGLAEGDIIGFAIDLDGDLFWCRNGAGDWNGSGVADPATGTGGITLPGGLTSGDVFAALSLQAWGSPGDTASANFGASAFNQMPPSGFSAWG